METTTDLTTPVPTTSIAKAIVEKNGNVGMIMLDWILLIRGVIVICPRDNRERAKETGMAIIIRGMVMGFGVVRSGIAATTRMIGMGGSRMALVNRDVRRLSPGNWDRGN